MRRGALIGLAVAVAVAGCGGSGERRLTRGELISQGDQECRDQGERERHIGAFRDASSLAAKGDQLLKTDREALRRFRRLRAPTELQGDFDAYVKLIGDTLTVETKLVDAAKRGDTSQLRRQILEQQALRPRLSAAARKIGFKVCSQGAG
jgi:hypothetical protein